MGYLDGITQGFYVWRQRIIERFFPGSTITGYTDPENDEKDDTSDYETYSYVVYGTPLRETKCLFVPEMPDFFTDEELNTVYHSKSEYQNAVAKYGLIYKSMKFSNADTVQKLLEYSTDWVKNNYHGGITNFNVTVLDLHLTDPEFEKLLVGQRANVIYMDPVLKTETSQTLTVISAEYDLNNPEKNNYKIGIPDVTLNKVYGETSKSGGGGGGGGKTSDETDNETDTEVDELIDDAEAEAARQMEMMWAMFFKGAKNGELDFQTGDLDTPNSKDPASDWTYGVTADIMKSSRFQSVEALINSITGNYITLTGGVDSNKASINDAHTGVINNDDKITTKDLEVSNELTALKDIIASEAIKGKSGEFTNMKVGGYNFSVGSGTITINGTTYDLSSLAGQ